MSKMRIVKMITNCSLESVLPQQSKLLIRILETHFMMLWYKKKLVLTVTMPGLFWCWQGRQSRQFGKYLVKQFQIIDIQGHKPRDLHHFKSFLNFKARSKINLKFSEKFCPINGFREHFKYLLVLNTQFILPLFQTREMQYRRKLSQNGSTNIWKR